ncbi:MAG: 2OG-Fe(II) oxygenase [Immundisolibacterales bacterium]|nr:2OG-Fe(II) oxygenase [Immundisolibacterales bacterium]
MGAVDIQYSTEDELERLLRSIDRPGDFCTHGRLFSPMPRLEVEGAGLLSFPIPEAQVRALIEMAERAPYGKGPDTLVDTSVRDCRQIDSGRVRLSGAAWPDTFAKIMRSVAAGLGYPGDRLDARLYKLLIYETGGFFSAHRDTEKADGMIGTLSISLPVACGGRGGEIVIRHRDREVVADMNAGEPSELAFAAFYADCTHEIRPVVSGHRLSLVFNLCLRPGGDEETPRSVPDYTEQAELIARRLVEWRHREDAPEKLVWLLDHEYSEAGLSFEALKNGDASLARTLHRAAARADCELHAAIVHIHEHGDATLGGDYVDSWGWNKPDVEDMEIGELYDSTRRLDSWVSPAGDRPPFGELALRPDELLPHGALDDAEPDEQWLHEASGNEGISLERAYRRAAFVIWPRSRTLAILAGGGIDAAVAWVVRELDRNGGVANERIGALVSSLIDRWPSSGFDRSEPGARARTLRLLTTIGDATRAARFLREVIVFRYGGDENESLAPALELVGLDASRHFLAAVVDSRFPWKHTELLAFLRQLDEEHGESARPAWDDALQEGVRAALLALPAALAPLSQEERVAWDSPRRTAPTDRTIRDLFALAWRWRLTDEAQAAARAIIERPDAVTPDRVLPAALRGLREEAAGFVDTAAFATLWRHATDFLLARSAEPPAEPRDWLIAVNIACRCEHCRKLTAFCRDPDAKTARFPLRKELRAHLHQTIDRHRLDISHVTERRGRPYTLVCTKNRASHRRRLGEYAEDVTVMRTLIQSAPGGEQFALAAPALARLQAAIAGSAT